MADVKSKNLYELLGNDHDQDSDKEPDPPTKAIDKPAARTTKRNAPDVAPARASHTEGVRGGRGRGGYTGNDRAFNDRSAGRGANRDKPVDDSIRDDRHPRRGGRGGRGATFKENRDDRRSHGRPNEHEKQANASWGGATGGDEWDDEKAGEAIANADAKDPAAIKGPDAPTDADGNHPNDAAAAEPEPEDNSKSYAEYLAEQAEKKLGLGTLEARKPNEGSKENKKWASAKAINKDEEEDEYIAGKEGKAARQRQRKEKVTVDINHRWDESSAGGGRGGRGEGRGRGRGEFRGRGEGRGRGGRGGGGDFRGGRGGGERGGRGGAQVNLQDSSAFPSLGS